jgi:hypothetical protein
MIVGVGDPLSDVIASLTHQSNEKIDSAKAEILAKVEQEGRQAKIVAVVGGFAAGILGAYLYERFMR